MPLHNRLLSQPSYEVGAVDVVTIAIAGVRAREETFEVEILLNNITLKLTSN